MISFYIFSILLILFAHPAIIAMKKDVYFQFDSLHSDSQKQREKISTNAPYSEFQSFTLSSKKSLIQSNNFQPVPLLQRPLLSSKKSEDYGSPQTARVIQSTENPQKVKSNSLHEKMAKSNAKIEYLAYAQKQFKEQKQKKVNFSSILESEHRLKDDLIQIKSKLQCYFEQLQKKDEVIVRKEKQLIQINKRYELAKQKIDMLENKCGQLELNNHRLYEQCLKHQENEDYHSNLFDNYRILSQKCSQIEQILQQKDAYIEGINASKANQYNSAINNKNHQIKTLEERIRILQADNNRFLATIRSQTAVPKPLQYTQQYDSAKYEALGQEFETKINFYVNENSKLKNTIANYEGQLEELKKKVSSLEGTVTAYEDRDKVQKISIIEEELELLRDALEYEKMEKDELVSRHQLEILRLENSLSAQRLKSQGSLIHFVDQERLRENLYLALEDVARLNLKLTEMRKSAR